MRSNWSTWIAKRLGFVRTASRRQPPRWPVRGPEPLEDRSTPATITVTGTGDTVAVDSLVTLREAITSVNNQANANTDVVAVGNYGTNDKILFALGNGIQVINVSATEGALP